MIELLLSLPTWAGCIFAMGFTTVLGLVVYLVSYNFISKYQSYDLKDPTSSLFRVVGLLVSLMLSLAFSEVVGEVRVIRNAIEREAVAISDTFTNLKLFDIKRTEEPRSFLVEYIWSKRCTLNSYRDINLDISMMLLTFLGPETVFTV